MCDIVAICLFYFYLVFLLLLSGFHCVVCIYLFFFFFFFKQKTAYEMRISDWSSEVCSSDLGSIDAHRPKGRFWYLHYVGVRPAEQGKGHGGRIIQIGRASCRERVCQYV